MRLRFVEQKAGIFKWLMRLAQYGNGLCHVDAETPEGTYIGAHLLGGVQEFKHGYDAGFKEEIFVNIKLTKEQEDKFLKFIRSHLREPYDPIAIVYFWGPFASKNWHDPNAWECTQFIAEGLIHCGWLPPNERVPAGKLTPTILYYLTSTLEVKLNAA